MLKASSPLFINIGDNGFVQDYLSTYAEAQVSCYNTHFEDYISYSKNNNISSHFTAEYKSNITHDLVVLAFPKSKAELNFTLSMIAHTTSSETNIVIVGDNKSGIKSLEKLTKETLINCNKVDSARHCLLVAAKLIPSFPIFSLEDWYEYYDVSIETTQVKVAALPGVFSQKGLDKGTKILLENFPETTGTSVLDFCCGSGVIASFIGKKYTGIYLSLLDVSALAIASAEKTLHINKLTGDVFASNSLSKVTKKYSTVISNPPFHQGVNTNYQATESFLKGIKSHLHKAGQVIVVANSFLQYEPIMKSAIGKTQKLTTTNGFTIYHCQPNK
jgi:16S rRNA (guanine1207-N2)-methyltransferase